MSKQITFSAILIQSIRILLNSLLKEAMALDPDDFKIICFFTTARLTQFFAELFNLIPGGEFRVLEIHSRKSQSSRTKVSDK